MPLVKVDEVKFVKELYPRFELDNYSVNQYRQSIDLLPPILISRSKILVDGYHRIIAHKLEEREEIEVEYFESEDENEIFIEAIKRNNSHGKQLSIEEKQRLTPILYNKGLSLEDIQIILAIGKSKAYDWTKNIRIKEREERDAEILELYLQCYSYREIAEKLGFDDHSLVGRVLENSINGKIQQPDNVQYYNLWKIQSLHQTQLKYPGQTPLDLVENVIYYYTDPPKTNSIKFDLVVDPMAGSGIVREACRKLYRQYLLYDKYPVREDIPIKENDILNGLPEEVQDVDLFYLDPPYFDLINGYKETPFTESYDSYLKSMNKVFEVIKPRLSTKGKIAFELKPYNAKNGGTWDGEWYDLTFDTIKEAQKYNLKIIKRICAPLTPAQFSGPEMTRAQENRVLLNLVRDVVIMGAA